MKIYSLACQFRLMMQTHIRTIYVNELVEQFLLTKYADNFVEGIAMLGSRNI